MKIVFDITCTPLSGAAGNLFMMSTASGTSVPLTLVNDTLQEDDTADDGSSQQFAFQNCTSTFMDLTPTDTTFYGSVLASFVIVRNTIGDRRDLPPHVFCTFVRVYGRVWVC